MVTDLFETEFICGAEFTPNREHRLNLWRIWDANKPLVMFIGLNPSTANDSKDDNTIKKLIKIAKHNGYGGFKMVNLFTLVSTKPKALVYESSESEIIDLGIISAASVNCSTVVFAWGNFEEAKERGRKVIEMFEEGKCLLQNRNGSPKHPLYCLDTQEIIDFVKNKPNRK